jgi:hypothetical protein
LNRSVPVQPADAPSWASRVAPHLASMYQAFTQAGLPDLLAADLVRDWYARHLDDQPALGSPFNVLGQPLARAGNQEHVGEP